MTQETTLYHAAKAYFTVLRNLQWATSIYQAAYGTVPAEWDTGIRESMVRLRPIGEQIVNESIIYVQAKLPGWKHVEAMARVTVPALDETVQMLERRTERPAGSLGLLDPAGAPLSPLVGRGSIAGTIINFLRQITFKEITKGVAIGLGVVIVAGAAIVVVRKFVLPGNPWKEIRENLIGEQQRHEQALAAAAGNPEGIRAENALHAQVMKAMSAEIPGADCPLLSTPLGTLLGAVAGVAVGYSGIRKLVRAI